MSYQLKAKVSNQSIKIIDSCPLVSNSIGVYQVVFVFDESWINFTKTATFCCEDKKIDVVVANDLCTIPSEVLIPNKLFKFGVSGVNGDIKKPTMYTVPICIELGAEAGSAPNPPTPTIYDQILEEISKTYLAIETGKIKGDSGVNGIDGRDGSDGASAYQVARNNGFIGTEEQWLNSLQGADGQDGATGLSGEDGFSPTVQVSTIVGGHKVAITDKTGLKQFDILDGIDGRDGSDGQAGLPGNDGINGVTFVPSVSSNGVISWTNNGGLNNPAPISIKGQVGDIGATGNGIFSTVLNADYTLTLQFTDGSSYTTSPLKGDSGAKGDKGDKGDPFIYEDFTSAQLEALKGADGANSAVMQDTPPTSDSVFVWLDTSEQYDPTPTKVSQLENDAGYITGVDADTKISAAIGQVLGGSY